MRKQHEENHTPGTGDGDPGTQEKAQKARRMMHGLKRYEKNGMKEEGARENIGKEARGARG
ncbi:MAG: hypothetical protein M0R18_09280 [Deltaproteobacteria bacterium]|jgi:hypothetical protein|nr:hypothetical protein [Deltaproteobacteria bacterium]MDX9760700.1 hypothetical protein [Desulfomonilia bacterium]